MGIRQPTRRMRYDVASVMFALRRTVEVSMSDCPTWRRNSVAFAGSGAAAGAGAAADEPAVDAAWDGGAAGAAWVCGGGGLGASAAGRLALSRSTASRVGPKPGQSLPNLARATSARRFTATWRLSTPALSL